MPEIALAWCELAACVHVQSCAQMPKQFYSYLLNPVCTRVFNCCVWNCIAVHGCFECLFIWVRSHCWSEVHGHKIRGMEKQVFDTALDGHWRGLDLSRAVLQRKLLHTHQACVVACQFCLRTRCVQMPEHHQTNKGAWDVQGRQARAFVWCRGWHQQINRENAYQNWWVCRHVRALIDHGLFSISVAVHGAVVASPIGTPVPGDTFVAKRVKFYSTSARDVVFLRLTTNCIIFDFGKNDILSGPELLGMSATWSLIIIHSTHDKWLMLLTAPDSCLHAVSASASFSHVFQK